jgi:hypothetical protein
MNECTVDWAAAGSWAQAFAGALGAGAVVYAARKGASTFNLWLRQRQTEHRIAAADRILTLAYRAELAFPSIRARLLSGSELEEAEKKLKGSAAFDHAPESRQQRFRTAQVYFDRLASHVTLWEDILAALPIAKAYFGPELAGHVRELLKQRHMISTAAEFYVDNDPDIGADVSQTLMPMSDDSDSVSVAIKAAISEIEAVLIPEIRSEVGQPSDLGNIGP